MFNKKLKAQVHDLQEENSRLLVEIKEAEDANRRLVFALAEARKADREKWNIIIHQKNELLRELERVRGNDQSNVGWHET